MKKLLALLSLCSLSILMNGCASRAKYIDSEGPRTIVSVDQVNIQDWSHAADQMIQSLLASGVLEKASEQPVIMAISRIVNDTTQQIDTDMLAKKIRVALHQSGKVFTTTTVGLGETAEDPLAESLQEAPPSPYFSLSGKILEDRASAGRTKQATYIFQLSLTQVSTGIAVWEEEVLITKQGEKASIGW